MRRTPSKARGLPQAGKKDATVEKIEKMEKQREERRQAMAKFKKDRAAEQEHNEKQGRPGDVDFQRMVDNWRLTADGGRKGNLSPAINLQVALRFAAMASAPVVELTSSLVARVPSATNFE